MLRRELRVNLRSFIIWSVVAIALFSIAYLVYPSIINNYDPEMLDKLVQSMPKNMQEAFNMDISSISSVLGWFKTEGYTYLILILGLYSAILGANILTKEENDKTIEFLYSKPISRNKILFKKILCGIIYIVAIVLVNTIFNLIAMHISDITDSNKEIILLKAF